MKLCVFPCRSRTTFSINSIASAKRRSSATRSEAVRQLIREKLTRQAWETALHEVAGTLTLVYDHHRTQLPRSVVGPAAHNTDLIISVLMPTSPTTCASK